MAENKEMTTQQETVKKAGFATIIGKPNVGKSTLMNRLIGQKIAITSYKPQTTRTQVRTILTEDRGQIVFLDTPGIHRTKTRMGEFMVKAASSTLKEVDVVLWFVEPKEKMSEEDKGILKLLTEVRTPVLILINKIDSVKKAQILPVIAVYQKAYDEAAEAQAAEDEAAGRKARKSNLKGIIPVSARSGDGVEDLLSSLFDLLPEGEPFFPEDMVTDRSERFFVSEILREKILRMLSDEIPHGVAVEISKMQERGNILDIEAVIYCEKKSHKAIIIGKGGEMLKRIASRARVDMEEMTDMKVNLDVWVKVRDDWREKEYDLKEFGYDQTDEA